jgi:hypothetical protein
MKMTTELIIACILILLILGFFVGNHKLKANENQDDIKVKKTLLNDNPYAEVRNNAINVTPEQLKLSIENDNEIYGVVMDWNMGYAIVTVVSFKTGDASVYLSKGHSFIGGFAHEKINLAAKHFVKTSEKYFSKATKTNLTEPTGENKIDFYLLTKSGKYYIEVEIERIRNNQSDFIELFNAGNEVINEYRAITDDK